MVKLISMYKKGSGCSVLYAALGTIFGCCRRCCCCTIRLLCLLFAILRLRASCSPKCSSFSRFRALSTVDPRLFVPITPPLVCSAFVAMSRRVFDGWWRALCVASSGAVLSPLIVWLSIGALLRCEVIRDFMTGIGALLVWRCVYDGLGGEAVAPVEAAKSRRAMVGRYIVVLWMCGDCAVECS
jgi:hypothetical protein